MRVGTFYYQSDSLSFYLPEWAVMPIVASIDMETLNSLQLIAIGKFVNNLDKHKEMIGAIDYNIQFDYAQDSIRGKSDIDDFYGEVYEVKVEFYCQSKGDYRITLIIPEWASNKITSQIPCEKLWQQKAIDSFFAMFPELFTRGKWEIKCDNSPMMDISTTWTMYHDLSPFIGEENVRVERCHTLTFFGIH